MLILTATNASEEIAILQTLGLGADILKDCLVVIGFEARESGISDSFTRPLRLHHNTIVLKWPLGTSTNSDAKMTSGASTSRTKRVSLPVNSRE